jgi:hypothetical protein
MLAWSQTRFFVTLAVAALLVMEPVSWITANIPGCIVNPENYAAYYGDQNHCPTFHVFLIALAARAGDHFGDPNWVIADFTAVLAFSTICLWVGTWRASVRQSRDMEASIGVAADTAKRQLRAYITVTGVKILYAGSDVKYKPNIRVRYKNVGQTPAYDVKTKFKSSYFGVINPPFKDINQSGGSTDLGPKQARIEIALIQRAIWDMFKEAVEKGAIQFFVLGEITYRDAFGDCHFTRYKLVLSPDDEGIHEDSFKFCPDGNESD